MDETINTRTPEEVQMSAIRLQRAFAMLDREVANGTIPGAAAAVGRRGHIVGIHATGDACLTNDEREPTRIDTIYDCASLTKVTVTLPLILMLIDQGALYLDEPVANIIPEFAANDKASITIKHLLTHTSGLPAHRDFHRHCRTPEEVRGAINDIALEYAPGKQMVYSDLGFIVLGEVVARLYDRPLDEAAHQFLFQPLGMNDSEFCPPPEKKNRIAATEYRERLGRYQRGEVHDENAAALGGVSGHAGLFSTVHDLARYATLWLARGKHAGDTILSRAVTALSVRNQTASLSARRGLGWVLKGDRWDASGDLMSPDTYGHTGFTGTSMWIDPAREMWIILLTNRVHFGRDTSISKLRARFHNAVAASLLEG